MTIKPVVPRAVAHADTEAAVEHYAIEAGPDVAIGFVDALEEVYRAIAANPGTGSTRWAHELNLPGLRSRRIPGYPWLVFYLEREAFVDVWRVLHTKRDIPGWMTEETARTQN